MFVLRGTDLNQYVAEQQDAVFVTCASFESRVLRVPRLLRDIGVQPRATLVVVPRDTGSRWEEECTAAQQVELDRLRSMYPATLEFPLDLVRDHATAVVDDVLDHAVSGDCERLILDMTTMPKSLLIPLVARTMSHGQLRNVCVTYTEVLSYAKEHLQSEPTQPEAVPPFDPIGLSRQIDVAWLPILGFSPDTATEIYQSFVDSFSLEGRVYPILGLPAIDLAFHERAFMEGTRGFIDSLRSDLQHEHFRYASAVDPFHTCDVILGVARALNPIHCIGSPLGPKPMTLGMILAAMRHEMSIVVAPARTYNPAYSVGSGQCYCYPIRQDGADLFGEAPA